VGAIQYEQPHVRRSSSMSFALRWKHENLRLISIVALISIALTFMFLMMLYGTATKQVSVVVNGQESVVYTKQWILQRLLDEQGISIGEHDRLSTSLGAKVKTGDRIAIDHAKPLQLTADGETKTFYTVAKTVGSALEELQISIGELDKVQPSLETELSEAGVVQIVRVKKEMEQFSEAVAFNVEKKSDSQLLKGKEQVVQEGQEGVIVKTKEKLFEDGKLISEAVVDEKVQSESVSKIVAIGTKNPVTVLSAASPGVKELSKSGMNFAVKQVINNVTLTAYSAGVSSTGKSSEHPQYGLTATGTRVMEGRTIAVDPTVIPLGWWVYIDGLGFRRAEDIGSAVKGNKVDVYFDSNDYANRFGMKRGNTIYVIGPNKPASD
jgi:uncharacterized protein YabE (DUF348 family)